jgi:phosphohistidine phosphatase
MELLLLRHAEANPANSGRDDERGLSGIGRRNAELVGASLARLDRIPELILSSPLVRARQTAEALVAGLGTGTPPEIRTVKELQPGATPATIMKMLEPEAGRSRVAVVGHQPDIGRVLSFMISGGSMELEFSIRPGTVCLTEVNTIPLKSPARLLLLVPPSVLAALAEKSTDR